MLGFQLSAGCEVLTKPHPVYAQFRGKTGYGIRRIAVISPRLHTVVDKCDVASKSADARDKHYLSCQTQGEHHCVAVAVPSSLRQVRGQL